jgi:hypothetical protein
VTSLYVGQFSYWSGTAWKPLDRPWFACCIFEA